MYYIKYLIKSRRKIILLILVSAALSIAVSFILHTKYTANTCFIPVVEGIGMDFGSSTGIGASAGGFLQMLGGMAVTPSDIYNDLITSRAVLVNVIDTFRLDTVIKAKYRDDLILKFSKRIKTKVSVTGFVKVYYTDRNKQRAADVANALVRELDRINKELIMTKGKRTRIFLDKRISEVNKNLKAYEDTLKEFQKRHGVFDIDQEMELYITNSAKIEAKIEEKKIMLNYLLSLYGENSTQVKNMRKQIKAIYEEKEKIWNGKNDPITSRPALKGIPDILYRYLELKRELTIDDELLVLLREEDEKAKILEKKDTPTLQVIYKATPPDRRSWPKRKLIVLVSVFGIVFLYMLYLFVLAGFEKSEELSEIKLMLTKALKHPFSKE